MANNSPQVSYYETMFSKDKKDISIENYIGFIEHGANQDLVLKARALKHTGDEDGYKKLKGQSKTVTGSAVMNDGSKAENNIKSLNGLIVIDIDTDVTPELLSELKRDKYSYIVHRSFGGEGACIFVRINPEKFEDSFNGLAQYYYETYNVSIDQACKNKNRLRYLSYDPDISVNDKAARFIAKEVKKYAEPKNTAFVYTKSDFDLILEQIRERNIDLCADSYHNHIRIGLALFDKFGAAGEETFHFICQYGTKYNKEKNSKTWAGLCRNAAGKVHIGTFYYYCKMAGIQIYSEKTKQIINRVKISKAQGSPTVESVVKNLKAASDIDANEEDRVLIDELIKSKNDYSQEANEDKSEIEQLEDFVINTYEPIFDEISKITYVSKNRMTDTEVNDIYLTAKRSFEFNVNMGDIRSILNSNRVRKYNPIKEFFTENRSEPTGIIEMYVKCISPYYEYNLWAFRKWLVGMVHNWTAAHDAKIVSPLTLVLNGQQHGTGKTSFLRNIMPAQLEKYCIETKINANDKDSVYRLCSSLLLIDDEFGGKAFKDVKEYKAISDTNQITQRRPYGREDDTYKRRAGLSGTTNEVDILKDVTGNRRILPISVEQIDYNRMLQIDKTALIMEAYNLLNNGFEWVIRTAADIEYLRINSQHNETIIPIEEVFFKHFSIEPTNYHTDEKIWNQGELLEFLNMKSILKPTRYDLKEVLVKNRLEYKNWKDARGVQKKGIKLWSYRETII